MRFLLALLALAPLSAFAQGIVGAPTFDASGLSVTATGGNTARTQANRAADTVNVLDFGVKGDGTSDDAPAIRAVFASNRNIVFPGGKTYSLCSTVAPGYPAFNNPAVLVSQKTNIHVLAKGATFKVCPAIALTQNVLFDRVTNWSWEGGTFVGDRTGLSASQENVGFGLINNVGFRIKGLRFTGYGGTGGAFVGDWNVDGVISEIQMDGVGIGVDMAFHRNMVFDKIKATGADTNGNSGSGQVGQKFFSNIYDVPLSTQNLTGISYTDTVGVTVTNTDSSNFSTGFAIASGSKYRLVNNYIHDNPGLGGSKGLGYYIFYNNGGVASSVGFAPSDIVIDGGIVSGNGSVVAGYGVVLSSSSIVNSDVIDGVSIKNVLFDNNNNTAIGADATAGIANLTIAGTTHKGALQTTKIDANALSFLTPLAYASAQATNVPLNFKTVPGGTLSDLPNNTGLFWRNTSAVLTPVFGVSGTDITYLRPASSGANVVVGDFSGAAIATFAASSITLAQTIGMTNGATFDNNKALNWKDGGAVARPILSLSPSNVTFLRPGSAAAYGQLQDYTGTSMVQWGAGGLTLTAPILTGTVIVSTTVTPASAAAVCTTGQHAWDASFTYVCVATNTWKRAALATW